MLFKSIKINEKPWENDAKLQRCLIKFQKNVMIFIVQGPSQEQIRQEKAARERAERERSQAEAAERDRRQNIEFRGITINQKQYKCNLMHENELFYRPRI
jgi:hypothetical protein